ncbi:MAG: hypothetical protein RR804_21185 [Massilia sp.]
MKGRLNVREAAVAAMRAHADQVSVMVERGAHDFTPRFGTGQDLALARHAQRVRRLGHVLQDAAGVDAAGASSIGVRHDMHGDHSRTSAGGIRQAGARQGRHRQ